MTPLANHLWQSTLCVAVAWLLTLALQRNRAAVRYAIWLAASIKFLVPFSLLMSAGSHLGWRNTLAEEPRLSVVVTEISRPFWSSLATHSPGPHTAVGDPLPAILFSLWLCGFAVSASLWLRSWLRVRALQRSATPIALHAPVPVLMAPALIEPGVFGIWRPVLLLPEGIECRLAPDTLDMIVAHELCHVRRRDNVTAAVHLLVESIFWFYPLLWWIRMRLMEERERACDQEVLRTSGDPDRYAEAILDVCRFYLSALAACMSGVTGAGLKKRIEAIVANRVAERLSPARKALLAIAAAITVASPILIGMQSAPASAQSQTEAVPGPFEVASIKPASIPIGAEGAHRNRVESTPTSLTMLNVDLSQCVQWAYGVDFYQLAGVHIPSDSYDILAKSGIRVSPRQLKLMLQTLLAQRFKLTLHSETRMLPVYELTVAKGGPKLPAARTDAPLHAAESLPRIRDGAFAFDDNSMAEFAEKLGQLHGVELPVVDRTGIKGNFDVVLKSAPEAARNGDTATLFSLIQEQLGLKLVSAKAPIEVIVIDHFERPSQN